MTTKKTILIIIGVLITIGIITFAFIFINKPKPLSRPSSKCGDGVCDEFEKKNPRACPQDCKPARNGTESCGQDNQGYCIDFREKCKTGYEGSGPDTCYGGRSAACCVPVESPVKTEQPCSQLGGNICSSSQTCSGSWLDASDSDVCCNGECGDKLSDVPYSAYYMHVENIKDYERCFDDIITLADKYNTPLTLMLWPQIRGLILNDPVKFAKMCEWQANGHEFGIHAQGCYGSDYCQDAGSCLKKEDAEKYIELIGSKNLKTAHVTPALFGYGEENQCADLLPKSVVYGGRGRLDGRNAISVKYSVSGRYFDLLNIKADYLDNPTKMAQYKTLNSDEVYFAGNHAECDLTKLEEWFKFLAEKDPEGKKRKTQSWIMENIIFPEGRSINENEIDFSVDSKIKQCSGLVGEYVFTDSWGHSPTDIFNFGRCILTGTFCYLDEKCEENNDYVPIECTLGDINNIENYEPVSEVCIVECGDGLCSRGEDRLDSPVYCPEDCRH